MPKWPPIFLYSKDHGGDSLHRARGLPQLPSTRDTLLDSTSSVAGFVPMAYHCEAQIIKAMRVMNVVNPHIRFVYEDYKSLPESMTKRYELLDGEMLMVPAPTTTHQIISRNIEFLLHSFVRLNQLGTVLYAPVDVVFGAGNAREIVQPDVLYISRERGGILFNDEIRGAPDLLVEVLSPGTEERDRTYKKHLYGRYGVREYWIADPDNAAIEVYVSAATDFEHPTIYHANDTLRSALFAGLDIDLQEVFDLR